VTRRGWRRRSHRGDYLRELQRDLQSVKRPNAIVVLWRWRWEVMLFLGLPAELTLLAIRLGWVWMLVAIAALMVTFVGWPGARYWLIAHVRCIITEHRVRAGCAQAWIQSRYGKLPSILLTTPEPFGERVYIWCWAGITLEDFEEARNILRSVCWASDVRVTSSPRYSHIVILDVVRTEDIN
jgi:hypothetical protein